MSREVVSFSDPKMDGSSVDWDGIEGDVKKIGEKCYRLVCNKWLEVEI